MRFFKRDSAPTRDFRILDSAIEEELRAGREYSQHLASIASRLPIETKSFALAPWYRDPTCHDCPHDSWLLDASLKAGISDARMLNLDMTLLGAYHDRILSFQYSNVVELRIDIIGIDKENVGDWLFD